MLTRWTILLTAAAILFAASPTSAVAEDPARLSVGQRFELSQHYSTSESGTDGTSASSNGSSAIEESVIAIGPDGIELEYDLPAGVTEKERSREWMFPARVLRRKDGTVALLNREALEGRLDSWLERAKWTREACGRWIFTWSAFKIECDPEAVLKSIESFDPGSAPLTDGSSSLVAMADAAVILRASGDTKGSLTFRGITEVAPDIVRRSRAEGDVVVGEIMGEPITLAEALAKREQESISGSIQVIFQTSSEGLPFRKETVTQLTTTSETGSTTETRTEIVERRPLARGA